MKPTILAIMLAASAAPAFAQTERDPNRPFEITDNSFLVEEAYNQEPGIFQNILLVQRPSAREWSFEFTQEWPLGSQRHQLSYTIPIEAVKEPGTDSYDVGRGTFALNYRLQLAVETASGPAISPRLSLLLPDFDDDAHVGVQFNLPISKQVQNFHLNANAGYTVEGIGHEAGTARSAFAAGSVIYRAWPLFHLMLESVFRGKEYGDAHSALIAPGFRAGFNLGDHQLVLGAAVPIGLLDQDETGLLAYFSYELPFRRQ